MTEHTSTKENRPFRFIDNTYIRDEVAEPSRYVELEIGDAKKPDQFYPQLKTKHWDNECNFSVRLVDDSDDGAQINESNGTIEWQRNGRTARFYDKDTGDEDGGFEFEVELSERPATNELEFSIETKGFRFYHQPELTAEEVAEGIVRPEHVVGSYAVYHETKRDNLIGGHAYRTGKAFHIYRPYAEDANGLRVWCDLHIDPATKSLTITIPQDFLDAAIYPIIIDPTIGYTSIGATERRDWNEDTQTSVKATGAAGNVTDVDFYAYLQGTGNTVPTKAALYDGSGNKQGNESGATNVDQSAQWHTVSWSGPSISAQTYYVAINYDSSQQSSSAEAYTTRYDSGSADDARIEGGVTHPTFPDPWSGYSSQARIHSIYATYTAATGVTVTPSVLAVVLSIVAPAITAIQNVAVSASSLSAIFTLPAPTVSGGALVQPSVLSLSASIQSPTVVIEDTTAFPSPLSATFSLPAPTVAGGAAVSPTTLTAAFSTPAPTIKFGVALIPSPLSLEFILPTPSRTGPLWENRERAETNWTEKTLASTAWTNQSKSPK